VKEIWKPIPNYEELYKISNYGKIINKFKKILCLNIHKSGHLYIKLCKNSKYKSFQIHRLVLETFVSPCPLNMECRHLNGNPADNRLENLKWGTRSENVRDAIKHKTHSNPPTYTGSNHPMSVINEKQARIIKWLLKDGYLKQSEMARIFNINKSIVSDIKFKRTWINV